MERAPVLALRWALAAALGLAACAHPQASRGPTLRDVPGTVVRVGDFGYALVPDSDPGTRYAPDRLPEAFQEDGLEVLFSGMVGDPSDTRRRWGTPLRLTDIRRRPMIQ